MLRFPTSTTDYLFVWNSLYPFTELLGSLCSPGLTCLDFDLQLESLAFVSSLHACLPTSYRVSHHTWPFQAQDPNLVLRDPPRNSAVVPRDQKREKQNNTEKIMIQVQRGWFTRQCQRFIRSIEGKKSPDSFSDPFSLNGHTSGRQTGRDRHCQARIPTEAAASRPCSW